MRLEGRESKGILTGQGALSVDWFIVDRFAVKRQFRVAFPLTVGQRGGNQNSVDKGKISIMVVTVLTGGQF